MKDGLNSSLPLCKEKDADLQANVVYARRDEAFEELYRCHSEATFALALSVTENRALAEDAFQEAMLRVWHSVESFRHNNVRFWLARIVERECIRLMKRRSREQARIKQAFPREGRYVVDNETILSPLSAVLAELSDADRLLMSLHYDDGLSQREIGVALSIPQQTISFRIRCVLNEVRKKLRRPSVALSSPSRCSDNR
jgi:RNA polymerase sigma-70 factor (ECF subfamily)